MATWEAADLSSSDEEDTFEWANLSLMADLPLEEDSNEVNFPYHELQDAFEELYKVSSILLTEMKV